LSPFCVVHLIGILLVAFDRKKVGAYVILASAIFFIPIGIVGVIGARKILDKLKSDGFFAESAEGKV